ncbi:FG-GAP-like repeat-containing protein, partial [Trichodesmium erythraeum 21-75]|nr:FG-GAP-like repeat-containing protein [Trichodesmium erythraeum 21-75]
DGAESVFAADVDRDGDVDILSASKEDDKIALYVNDGSNNFTEQTISTNADGAESVFAADVDDDGYLDIFSASSNDDKIALYLNDGSNNFTEQTISTNADGANSVFAADVDRDGDVDILSASRNDSKISLYVNNGSNNFPEQTISTDADGASSVFAADVNGNGNVDILSASSNDSKISLYFNDGSNNFTKWTISDNAEGASSVFAADVDRDGDVDVLSASRNDDKITLYETVSPRIRESINWGDVHFVTFDGRQYDLQSFGDFIMAQTARDDDEWVVQTRQQPWGDSRSVSVNTAFATLVDGRRVVFDLNFPNNRLQVDGIDFPLANGETKNIGNSKIERDSNKYTITYAGNDGIVNIDDPKLTAFDNNSEININISNYARMEGLLGNNDGDPTNDFALRDGTQLNDNLTVEEIHNIYGESWRVQEGESLFDDSAAVTGLPETFVSLDQFSPEELAAVRTQIRERGITDQEKIDTIAFDLLVTGDESFLVNAVEVFSHVDENSAATDLDLDNKTILENVEPNSLVGTFSTTDPDLGDSFTYALVAGAGDTDNTSFTINGDQLQINDTPDFETKFSYSIRVKTTDEDGAGLEQELTINIKNVNEDPTALNLNNTAINENEPANSLVGQFSTTDPD